MDDSSKRVTMIDNGVEVERTIEDRSTATVVMYRLETLPSTPSVVRLEEAIPPESRIETLEFHPNHRPNAWTIGHEMVQFDVMIPPDETRSVVLGIDADVDEPLSGDEPTITNLDSEAVDLEESAEAVPLTRGGDTGSSEDDESSVLGLDTDTVGEDGDGADYAGMDAEGEDDVDAGIGDATAGTDGDEVLDLEDPNEVGLDPATEGPEQPSTTDGDDDSAAGGIVGPEPVDTEESAEDATIGLADDDATIGLAGDDATIGLAGDDATIGLADDDAATGEEDDDESAKDAAERDADDAAETADDADVVDASSGEPVIGETAETGEAAEPPDMGEAKEEGDTAEALGEVDTSSDSHTDDRSEESTGPDTDIGSDNGTGTDDAAVTDDRDGFDGMEPATPADKSQEDSAPAADADSLVGNLLEEIEAGHASEDELDALRSELGIARADEVRFEHMQSRMEDFEAYANALEEIINTHGTASEFVDGIERKVTDLNDEISAVRSEVTAVEEGVAAAGDEREELTDEVEALDETVAGLTDELAELHDLVETVDDRTDTLETDLREELDEVRDEHEREIERIETELETVREQLESDFETEFDSLRDDVESLNEVRRTLLSAFGEGIDPTDDDEMAEGDDA
ncbi:MAG: hypothetical protein V5A38_09480 [Halolamina sp.]|uniref:hypothetical protein n=1 Tax=Halolamina sp. TaxID=1940283 RepID=UPI002FC36B78